MHVLSYLTALPLHCIKSIYPTSLPNTSLHSPPQLLSLDHDLSTYTSSQPLPYPGLLLPINVKWKIKKRKKGEKRTYSYHHKAYNHKRLANSEIQK